MLLGTLGASLLGSLLRGKGFVRDGEETITAAYGSSIKKSYKFTTFFDKF